MGCVPGQAVQQIGPAVPRLDDVLQHLVAEGINGFALVLGRRLIRHPLTHVLELLRQSGVQLIRFVDLLKVLVDQQTPHMIVSRQLGGLFPFLFRLL